MSFRCPECGNTTLLIEESLDLGSDDRFDERALQMISCGSCGFTGAALYGESRRGPLDSESVDHAGYCVPDDVAAAVREAVRSGTVPSGLQERIREYGSFRIVYVPQKS